MATKRLTKADRDALKARVFESLAGSDSAVVTAAIVGESASALDAHADVMDELLADAEAHAAALESALRGVTRHPHVSLGDLVYAVREREGEGWDGPLVKQWSDAVKVAEALTK